MSSNFVAVSNANPTVRLSYSRVYRLPEADRAEGETASEGEAEPIGWDPRYGTLFLSENALLYGPYLAASSEEKFVLAQMPNIVRDRGKKCLYRIFEMYTAVKLGRNGLRARPRDPATDRAYYFPTRFPTCLALSVAHFDEDISAKCAVLVYKFRAAEVAALAFKMLTTFRNSPHRNRRSPSPTAFSTIPHNSRASLHRNASSRCIRERDIQISGTRRSMRQSRPRQVDMQSSRRWNEAFIDFGGVGVKPGSVTRLSRGQSKRRSKSGPREPRGVAGEQVRRQHKRCYCCHHQCPHCASERRVKYFTKTGGVAGSGVDEGSLLIMNGKKYPISLFHELMNQMEETVPVYWRGKITKRKNNSEESRSISSSSSSSSRRDRVRLSNGKGKGGGRSKSSEPVVELVFDKLKNSSTLNGSEVTFQNEASSRNGGEDEGRSNSITVIRLSRQGDSDSERGEEEGEGGGDGYGYLASPPKVLGDGTTVYNLYGRQKSEGGTSHAFTDTIYAAEETPDENV